MHDVHDVKAIVFGCAHSKRTKHETNSAQWVVWGGARCGGGGGGVGWSGWGHERINYSATILLNNAATAVKHLMDPTWVMQLIN